MTKQIWLDEYKQWNIESTITLPDEQTSLLDLWDNSFNKFQQRKAFIFADQSFSYAEIDLYSRKVATFLQSLGLEKGTRVAVMMPNIIQYPIISLAVIRAGYILVNINPLYTARELKHQLNDAGAKVLFILEQFLPVYDAVKEQVSVEQIITTTMTEMLVDQPTELDTLDTKKYAFKQILLKANAQDYIRPKLILEDTALLQYTGGTTGVSKGAELTHKNIVANLLQNNVVFKSYFGDRDAFEDEIAICALPLYHIFGFTVCLLHSAMNKGYATVLVSNPRDLDALVHCFEKYRPTVFPAVNTLFNALLHHEGFNKLDHSRLEITTGGGMAILKSTADGWEKLTGRIIREGYGLSETSPVAPFNPPISNTFSGTIGIPVPSTDIAILDDEGHQLAPGETGEIAIRGPQVMKGYWNLPEETKAVMTADGFFRTGDIGFMNEKGYTKIIDRKKDMILVSGFNVFPNEIEEVLAQHPKILEVAVVGIADEKSGEVPKAFIVKKDDSLSVEEIQTYAKENLTGYKQPRHIQFINELPKSNVGKILRKELKV
ncbi:AMP-binding enzyme family protein [Acinetobacter baumannii 541915]|uniref:AMP-binding protein n=1 Tax=Acinetobacter baumannii TaxID=470 RepID=UPI000447A90E|nr:AMP-binding protein [Acinetobacter baumannii]EXR80147.1 AMP-binding enzyme family protein [Acinetobacter baumannii 541915]